MKKYLLAIDQGTTSCRSIIFDLKGKIIYSSQKKLKQFYTKDSGIEQDLEELWQIQLETLKNCLNKIDSSEVLALGITNQRETIGLWDKTGKTLGRAISWQCQRTKNDLAAFKPHEAEIKQISGLPINAYFSASKLKWLLQKHKPEQALAGTIDTWLLYKLTGQHLTDVSNASRTLLFDLHKNTWSDRLLELFQIPENILPQVCPSQADFGTTLKSVLGCEIPVRAMVGDQQAALYGQACLKAGMAELTCGTGGFLLVNSGEKIYLQNGLLTSTAWQLQNKAKPIYMQEASILSVGSMIEWLNRVGLIPKTENLDHLIEEASPESSILIMPAITGYGSPNWERTQKAEIINLMPDSTGANILKATIEGIAFRAKEVIDCIPNLSELRLGGGLAKSAYFGQFLANLLNIPILRSNNTEASAWGAASMANWAYSENEILDLWKEEEKFNPKDSNYALKLWEKWKNEFSF